MARKVRPNPFLNVPVLLEGDRYTGMDAHQSRALLARKVGDIAVLMHDGSLLRMWVEGEALRRLRCRANGPSARNAWDARKAQDLDGTSFRRTDPPI